MLASGVFSWGKGYDSVGVVLLRRRSVVVTDRGFVWLPSHLYGHGGHRAEPYTCAEFRPSGVRSLGLRRGSEAHTLD